MLIGKLDTFFKNSFRAGQVIASRYTTYYWKIITMKYLFELDREEPIEIDSLVGSIKVIGDDDSIIAETAVYVDDWLTALVEGFSKLSQRNMKVEVDILSEPSDLIFQKNDNEVKLIYKNISLLINSYDEAISKLKDVIKLLFKELEHIPNWKDDLALTELIKFIE